MVKENIWFVLILPLLFDDIYAQENEVITSNPQILDAGSRGFVLGPRAFSGNTNENNAANNNSNNNQQSRSNVILPRAFNLIPINNNNINPSFETAALAPPVFVLPNNHITTTLKTVTQKTTRKTFLPVLGNNFPVVQPNVIAPQFFKPVIEPDTNPPTSNPIIDKQPNVVGPPVFVTPSASITEKDSTTSLSPSNSTLLDIKLNISSNNTEINKTAYNVDPKATNQPQLFDHLCGFPAFVANTTCYNVNSNNTLWECSNKGGAVVLGMFAFILGVIIVFANSLLPMVVWKQKNMRNKHNLIKVSLSIADMILGFILLGSFFPNYIIFLRSTRLEAYNHIYNSVNTAYTIVGGCAINLTFQASIIHLMLLSVERFIAIQWPLWNITRSGRAIQIELSVTWVVTIIICAIPAMTPKDFQFVINPVVFVPLLSSTGTQYAQTFVFPYVLITSVIPYIFTVGVMVITAFVIFRKLHLSKRMTVSSHKFTNDKEASPNHHVRPKVSVFITTIIMVAGFTITLLPFTIVTIIFVSNTSFNCDTYALSYTITFFILIFTGLMNSLIYSIRNPKFRNAVRNTFCKKQKLIKKITFNSTPNNTGSTIQQSSTSHHHCTTSH